MSKIKVLHGPVNYGTQAGLFAKKLREKGVYAFSIGYEDRYKRLIDYELKTSNKLLLKHFYKLLNIILGIFWFFKFNTFHFYYGKTLLPNQFDLPFYKIFKKKILFHYLGKDVKTYKESVEKYKISNMQYSYKSPDAALKADNVKKKRLKYETKYANFQIVCSPVYTEFVPNSILLPLGIDLNDYEFSPMQTNVATVTILHAPTSRDNKGTKFIVEAIEKLKIEGLSIKFLLCENISHKELKEAYKKCDIFIDQVLGGYGTAAIEAMAIGRPTISYIRDIHFNENTFPGGIPILSANKDNIYIVLKNLIENKKKLSEIGKTSRQFVEKHHNIDELTNKLIEIYRQQHNNNKHSN